MPERDESATTGRPDDDIPAPTGSDRRRLRRVSRRVEDRFFDDDSPHLDRFGSLLALTVASVVALSVIDLDSLSDTTARGVLSIVLSTTTGVTLVLALRAAGVARRGRRIAEAAVVIAFLTSVIGLLAAELSDAEPVVWQPDRPSPLWVVIAVVTPVAVIHRLITHRRISAGTLAGAIAAYLLIALAFCYIFLYLDGAIDGFFDTDEAVPSYRFMYFSLTTITTVGYGDLVPAGRVSGLLAMSEAVIGQIYLVTFVAMLVGLMIQQRNDRPSRGGS